MKTSFPNFWMISSEIFNKTSKGIAYILCKLSDTGSLPRLSHTECVNYREFLLLHEIDTLKK